MCIGRNCKWRDPIDDFDMPIKYPEADPSPRQRSSQPMPKEQMYSHSKPESQPRSSRSRPHGTNLPTDSPFPPRPAEGRRPRNKTRSRSRSRPRRTKEQKGLKEEATQAAPNLEHGRSISRVPDSPSAAANPAMALTNLPFGYGIHGRSRSGVPDEDFMSGRRQKHPKRHDPVSATNHRPYLSSELAMNFATSQPGKADDPERSHSRQTGGDSARSPGQQGVTQDDLDGFPLTYTPQPEPPTSSDLEIPPAPAPPPAALQPGNVDHTRNRSWGAGEEFRSTTSPDDARPASVADFR
ncbi:hypothetical protein HWV62_23110 [Athelia sp. TMB]|nr:hypothetical protein HWV62_23110 [Athelia sp. TMB]